MGKSSGKRGAKEVIEKVSLKKQKKNKGKMQAIEKLKSETKTQKETIKKEKVSTKQKKKGVKKPKSKKSGNLSSAKKLESDPDDNKHTESDNSESFVDFYQEFHKCIAQAKAAEQACTNNLDNTQNLKKWAFALTNALVTKREYKINEVEFLEVAQSNLEHVLEIDPNDHDAIFYLGLVHFYFIRYDAASLYRNYELYRYHCNEGIECFKEFEDDQIFQAPEGHNVSRMRGFLEGRLVLYAPLPENTEDSDTKDSDAEEYDTEDPDMEIDNEISHEERLWDELRVAKIENAKNPENVESLRSWAHAMIGLSYCTTNRMKKQKFHREAIGKLEHAYKINPDDKKVRLELLKACMDFGDNEEKGHEFLVKEYNILYEELNPQLNEGNSSSWTLSTCQRNKKAVSSEDNLQTRDTPQDPLRVLKTLFVGNLPYSVEQADIVKFFKEAGKVVGVWLSSDAAGVSKGYGLVEFDTKEAAHKAVKLNDEQLMGRPLRIAMYKKY